MMNKIFRNGLSGVLIFAAFSVTAFCENPSEKNDVYSLVAQGRRLAKEHKYDEAIKIFSQAKNVDPRSALPDTGIGMMFLKMGEYSEAEKYLTAAESLDPNIVPVQYTLAMLYEKLGRSGDAIKYWNKLYNNPEFKESAKKHLKFLGVTK